MALKNAWKCLKLAPGGTWHFLNQTLQIDIHDIIQTVKRVSVFFQV